MIKLLTVQDLPKAADVGHLFMREAGFSEDLAPKVFVKKWSQLLSMDLGFILGLFENEELVGALGSVIIEDINHGRLVANEAFWFVQPSSRGSLSSIKLIKEYEDEARKRGAVRCSMVHLHKLQPEKLSQLYQRRGYVPVETAYYKELI